MLIVFARILQNHIEIGAVAEGLKTRFKYSFRIIKPFRPQVRRTPIIMERRATMTRIVNGRDKSFFSELIHYLIDND